MKKSLLFLAMLMMAGVCSAQEEVVLVPDRPGYTWGADVLPYQKISWENGFGFERGLDGRCITLPSTIVRYGIFHDVELRVGTEFELSEEPPFVTKQFGVAPLTIGTKIKCYEGEGLIPSVGVLAEFASPHVGSANLTPSHIAPHLYLLLEQSFNDSFGFCYNAGLEWDGETATPTTFLALGAWFTISGDLGGFVETNNYFHPDGNQYLTEFGLTFTPSSRIQLDVEADLDFQHLGEYFHIGCGVSWMIN